MASINLSDELIRHFNISEYIHANPGGQKTVFVVTINGQKHALKIIKIADERFEREVKICESFNHIDGIPQITRIEMFGNDTIILEEFIEGNDLYDIAKKYKGDANMVLSLIHKVALILTPIWESRYVHRDLKPQNIRIKPDGSPVVLDFGIARALDEESLTVTGGQPLSWLFASPEQYNGQKDFISYRTDFFCLGIIAFYLFKNSLPFGKDRYEIAETFRIGNIEVNTGNESIDNFCNSVFKISPAERPRNIELLLKSIQL